MRNIAVEVMLYETMFKRASVALVFKMSSTIKPEFKNYDDSFTSRLSFKNILKKCKGLPGDSHCLTISLFQQFFLAFHFTVLIMPLKRAGSILILRV